MCTASDWFVNADSSNVYPMFSLDSNRGLIHLPIIIKTHFWFHHLGEKKNPVLLQCKNHYAFEPNGAYLCKDWRSYWLWISRALVQIWLLLKCRTHTHPAGTVVIWRTLLSGCLCLLCLSHLAYTTVFFSFISLNVSHLDNK